jgi:MoaA/NifB/PqqE/SkfB family radical SAM enzyme
MRPIVNEGRRPGKMEPEKIPASSGLLNQLLGESMSGESTRSEQLAAPQDWLTDQGLTPAGKKARESYSQLVNYLHDLPIPLYRVSRALHLLQSNVYDTSPHGFALPPHTINLCVNNACNLRCSYCDLSHGRQGGSSINTKVKHNVIDPNVRYELSLEASKKLIDESAWFRPTIRVPWMEPLLYKNLLPLIRYTKAKQLPFSMLTNGLLLPKFAERLAEVGVDALRVSLDGPREVHDALCGVKGTYNQIIKGLKMLVEERNKRGRDINIGCYFTVNDQNYNLLVPMLEDLEAEGLLKEMFVGFFMFNYISKQMVERHNREHREASEVEVEETSIQFVDIAKIDASALLQQKQEIEDRFISKGARINFRPDFTEPNFQFSLSSDADPFPGVRCETHWHTLFINPEGNIKPLPQCILKPGGNISQGSLLDVWNGEEMRKQRVRLREYGAYHGCVRCWSIYSSIEDVQHSWVDHTGAQRRN